MIAIAFSRRSATLPASFGGGDADFSGTGALFADACK